MKCCNHVLDEIHIIITMLEIRKYNSKNTLVKFHLLTVISCWIFGHVPSKDKKWPSSHEKCRFLSYWSLTVATLFWFCSSFAHVMITTLNVKWFLLGTSLRFLITFSFISKFKILLGFEICYQLKQNSKNINWNQNLSVQNMF